MKLLRLFLNKTFCKKKNIHEIKAILNRIKDDAVGQWNAFKADNKLSESLNKKLGDFMWQIHSLDDHESKLNLLKENYKSIDVKSFLSKDAKLAIPQVHEHYANAQKCVLQKNERHLVSPPPSSTGKSK